MCVFSPSDPERWTNIPLLVKVFKLIVNELSSVVEANATRTSAADWTQGGAHTHIQTHTHTHTFRHTTVFHMSFQHECCSKGNHGNKVVETELSRY